jgi:hypothetical protein
MTRRALMMAIFWGVLAAPAHAGFYATIDTKEELRWDRDFRRFNMTLLTLMNIANDDAKAVDSPMRQRYLLVEAMGKDGTAKLRTLEQKLNYSAVLIRRGKAYEATQMLQPLAVDSKNFLVHTHLATAFFLSNNSEFREKAALQLDQALEHWPNQMEDVDPATRRFLEHAKLETELELERFKRIEVYFKRFMRHRIRVELLAKKNKQVEDTVDPIFIDEDAKGDARPAPVKFLIEDDSFAVGRIAKAEKAKLPRDAVEVVEQLLMWMPTDQRLLWLLGETMNACVMDYPDGDERNDMIRSAHQVFAKLDSFEYPQSFAAAIKSRKEALGAVAKTLPERRALKLDFKIADPDIGDKPSLANEDWWRALGVGFITGLAVGMFAIWQVQEFRRRRQR